MTVKNSIFDTFSIDRSKVQWDKQLNDLTPVEQVGNMWFKREDYFAPLGYGGINGSKLRQAIMLVKKYVDDGGKGVLISGCSVKSPQSCMGTAVAKHFGLDSVHVLGATKETTAMNHENIKMATWFGAKFKIIKVGYNPVLQNEVRRMIEGKESEYYYLNYGITTSKNSTANEILKFHMLGAKQVANIPEHIEDLIMPAGSCNSCTSILLGLMIDRPDSLKKVHLIGISPYKMAFVFERLKAMGELLGMNLLNFNKKFDDKDFITNPESDALDLYYDDLHGTGFTTYQDEIKFNYHGIDFHPTYEGKCFYYIVLNKPELIKLSSLFWIIGSKPTIANMKHMENELGDVPAKINIYG